ncbi:hypothetical protein TSAR_013334 [Trichomalopsis sarcophagae]|uniref:Uncharacterized protein n=1 Tax=Trichomalopsis sarcophagae TaxID=543379 RepID=A0A232EQX0_9HYME|nr:hypothetical protein TSAR_013334 [Trichomalopsis sarcophagae]
MMSELKTTFPQAGKATEPNPADSSDQRQREDQKILKGIIIGTIEYAENRSNVHGPIKTGFVNMLKELQKIEKIDYRQYRQEAIKALKEEET